MRDEMTDPSWKEPPQARPPMVASPVCIAVQPATLEIAPGLMAKLDCEPPSAPATHEVQSMKYWPRYHCHIEPLAPWGCLHLQLASPLGQGPDETAPT